MADFIIGNETAALEYTRIFDKPIDLEVLAGTNATFRCTAVVDPTLMLTFLWLMDGKEIDFNSGHFYMEKNVSLTIINTTISDLGCYTCVARTEIYNATATAKLTVRSPQDFNVRSGFDIQISSRAPNNFMLIALLDARTALISWESIEPVSLCGGFEGYKIHTWTNLDRGDQRREIIVSNTTTKAVIDKLIPFSKNYACVLAYNRDYDGPTSQIIEIDTPEGTPGPVESFEAYSLGTSSIYLEWKKPEHHNGILTGYRVFYEKLIGESQVGSSILGKEISDPNILKTKLNGFQPGTKYRIHIRATTRVGSGDDVSVEQTTFTEPATNLGKPKFKWDQVHADNENVSIKIDWLPNLERGSNEQPGSQFFVQYRLCENSKFENTTPEILDMYTTIRNLVLDKLYVIRVVSVDGNVSMTSEPIDVTTKMGGMINIDVGGSKMTDPCIEYRCKETTIVADESKYSQCIGPSVLSLWWIFKETYSFLLHF